MPRWQEVAVLLVATLVAAAIFLNADSVGELANFLPPTLLLIALALGCLQLVQRSVAGIWIPAFWMRIALLAYVGVGSLVPYFLNVETRNLMDAFYNYYPEDVAKYNLITCLFCLIFLLFFGAVSKYIFDRQGFQKSINFEKSRLGLASFSTILLLTGLFIQLVVSLPAQLGLYEGTFPVVLFEIAFAGQIGIFLLTYYALENESKLLWATYSATAIFTLSGVILFNKSVALFSLVMLAMGYIYHKPNFRRILGWSAAILISYALLAPLVSFGRDFISQGSSDDVQASISERLTAIQSYIDGERQAGDSSQIQSGWARLSYVNVGTFAISQYDLGQPGDSLKYLPIVWVPRLLYPSKPIMTDIARDFNYAATGSVESSSTPGLPTEGYWDYGWWGLPFFAAIVALISAAWSHYTIAVVRSEAWHLFFIVLLGMRVGTRVDGMLVTDLVGPVGFAIAGHIVLQFLNRLVLKRRGIPSFTTAKG